jgi:CBS domain-containing protein
MQVRDVMNKNVIVGKKDLTIKEASEVMSKLRIGSLVITEDQKIIGIITSTDIIKSIASEKKPDITLAEEVMTKDVLTIDPEATIEEAVEIMIKNKVKKLPVVSEDKIVGIVTASDIVVVEPKLIATIASLVSLKTPYAGG